MENTEEIDTASPVASWADEVESAEAAERTSQEAPEQETPSQAQGVMYYQMPDGTICAYDASASEWSNAGDGGYYGCYYTAEAVSTCVCSSCDREFHDPRTVLQHLRDHWRHKDTVEAQEAAMVLYYQDMAYAQQGEGDVGGDAENVDAAGAPSSDTKVQDPTHTAAAAKASSRKGRGKAQQQAAAQPPASAKQQPKSKAGSNDKKGSGSNATSGQAQSKSAPDATTAAAGTRSKGGKGKGGKGAHAKEATKGSGKGGESKGAHSKGGQQEQQAGKPEAYEDVFPALNGKNSSAQSGGAGAGGRRWVPNPSSRKLRVAAKDWAPCESTAQPPAAPSTPPKQQQQQQANTVVAARCGLRVDAPNWAPPHQTCHKAAAAAIVSSHPIILDDLLSD